MLVIGTNLSLMSCKTNRNMSESSIVSRFKYLHMYRNYYDRLAT